ncbi:MAG: hypothetical protein ACR2N3_06720 [Pyrinomonadaceae bacterium]
MGGQNNLITPAENIWVRTDCVSGRVNSPTKTRPLTQSVLTSALDGFDERLANCLDACQKARLVRGAVLKSRFGFSDLEKKICC